MKKTRGSTPATSFGKMTDGSESDKQKMIEKYHLLILRKWILFISCIIGIIIFVGMFSLSAYGDITFLEAYEIIWNHIVGNTYEPRSLYWWADRHIWNIAIPHVLAAIFAGMTLAVCGVLMQSVMVNPLADPYSTGISSGACFGAVVAIVLGTSIASISSDYGIVSNAFLGALVPALIIIILAERIRMTPATLILLGTAISYFFNSMVTYLMISTDADTLKSAYLWQVGSLSGISWQAVSFMAVITIAGSIFVLFMSNQLNVMALGERSAISLGLDVKRFRVISLLAMALMTAGIVSFTGILGFIGLVAPHIVRLVIGSDNKYVVPISMVVGAFILLIADYVSSQLSNVPVGVVLMLIGSPIFFLLIVFQSKRTGAIY